MDLNQNDETSREWMKQVQWVKDVLSSIEHKLTFSSDDPSFDGDEMWMMLEINDRCDVFLSYIDSSWLMNIHIDPTRTNESEIEWNVPLCALEINDELSPMRNDAAALLMLGKEYAIKFMKPFNRKWLGQIDQLISMNDPNITINVSDDLSLIRLLINNVRYYIKKTESWPIMPPIVMKSINQNDYLFLPLQNEWCPAITITCIVYHLVFLSDPQSDSESCWIIC